MLCRHLSAHKLSATEEQPSHRERGTEHCVKEREEGRKGGGERSGEGEGKEKGKSKRPDMGSKEKRRGGDEGNWEEETKAVECMDG